MKKIPRPGLVHKIHHEMAVYSLLKNKACPFILKVYFSEQQNFKDCLLSDFYKYSSLDSFLAITKIYTHLTTKLYLISSTILGIMVLHANNILHLDIKSHNLMVGTSLVVRMCDFG